MVVSLMKGTSTMGTPSETNLGSMLPIDMQQKFEKVWVLKEDSAHNKGVFRVESKDSPLEGLQVKFFEGARPHALIYFAKNHPRNHQITWLRSSGVFVGIQGQGWPGSDTRIEDGQRVGTGVWSASGADFAVEEGHTGAIREVV